MLCLSSKRKCSSDGPDGVLRRRNVVLVGSASMVCRERRVTNGHSASGGTLRLTSSDNLQMPFLETQLETVD